MKCEDKFFELYRMEPDNIMFCPYRVCPIGAHSDHQLGKITGFAIDKGIHIAYKSKDSGVIELSSLQFEKRAQFHINFIFDKKQGDWADYLRGVTIALLKRYPLKMGIGAVIEGSLPIGGLSSSAAVCIAFLKALCDVNSITLSPLEIIEIALEAENKYVGVSCGKLDQSCEVYSKKNHLLYLDTKDESYELIPVSPKMLPFKIAIFFSGIERTLAGSKFNMRVDECRAAGYALKAFANLPYGKFDETFLRDIPYDIFLKYENKLPENWKLRAKHWYSEFKRVECGAEAWRRGDIVEYGRLSFESGESSIYNWQTGSDELKAIYEIMKNTEGVYGGRFSGAGFKGCCMALIDPNYEEQIKENVKNVYLKRFPHLKGKFSVHICQTNDGVCS